MSNYHFGDDYDLNYYPHEASDGMGGVDWDKVESVEIECADFVRKPDDKSRWYELFGTPERAAQTLETVAEALYASAWADDSATLSDVLCSLVAKCDACPAMGAPGCGVSTRCGAVDYEMMLEWLRSDA